jgi:hypothetical protein
MSYAGVKRGMSPLASCTHTSLDSVRAFACAHSPTTAVSGVKRNQSSVVFFQTTRGGYSASAERLPPVGAPVGVDGTVCVPLTCSHTAAHASTTVVQVIHTLHGVRAILREEKKEDDGVPPPVQSERAAGVADKRCGQRTATTQFA